MEGREVLSDEEILAEADELEARMMELKLPKREMFVRRYPAIPEEHEKTMWRRAEKLARRNPDSELTLDDIMSRYVERYYKKRRYFDGEKYSWGQFLGLICNNIDAELMPRQIESREKRRRMIWLDLALESHGAEELDSDTLFVNDSLALLAREVLAEDVRETIARIKDENLRDVAEEFMKHSSIRQLAAHYGVEYSSFKDGLWLRFKRAFKSEWGKKLWTSEESSVQVAGFTR